jgi:hypothetical protein
VSTIQDFLEGSGFSPDEYENIVVNAKGETFFQVHQKTCKDFGEFEGFYWLLRYNRLGKITDWEVLPFENCRLGKPDAKGYISKILYNPFFGTHDYTTTNKNTVVYDVYDPIQVTAQIRDQGDAYKGQVYFCGTTNALSRFYPMPIAYSAFKWFKIEEGVQDYYEDHINNGLLIPYILVKFGNPNSPANNPEGDSSEKPQTIGEAFDEVVSANFMGAKRVGNTMVDWVANKEEKPEVVPLPNTASGDQFLAIDSQATKKITVAFKVPAILANISEGVSLGGDGNMIRVAVKLMQQRMIPKQRILTDKYQMILKNFQTPYMQEITIAPYNPYPELEVLDDKIWNIMTREEQRDWVDDNTNIILTEPAVVAPQARQLNAIPVGFPDKVRANVKKAIDFNDKMGIRCVSRASRTVSDDIMNNASMGYRQLKRIHSYLERNDNFKNKLLAEGCEVLKYHAWGGRDMFDFLDAKLKDVDQWLN